MKKTQGRSFVTIMMVIAVAALLLRTTVEQIIRINIEQNESDALSTLKIISTALENYAKDHRGAYPSDLGALTRTSPPYLELDYIAESPVKGYTYSCSRLEPSSYSCSATPLKCRLTGQIAYSISTGGSLASEACVKKE